MTEFAKVGTQSFIWLIIGAVVFIAAPILIALVWKIRRKEPLTSILIGAATFVVFALMLEKPIQNVLLFPTAMGLPDHPVSRFFAANPVLLALLAGLFPGVFEETGRFIAFKTLLKKRTDRETSISHGIGHGGIEVVILMGVAYVEYIAYAVMINTGLFQKIVEQVAAYAPDQLATVTALADQLAAFSAADLGINAIERVFAVLFHIGASILVFYAVRDTKRFWLYPLAVILHTALDFVAALCVFNVISLNNWALEGVVAAFGIAVFAGAYILLYRKDKGENNEEFNEA